MVGAVGCGDRLGAMKIFNPATPNLSPRHAKLYAMYEVAFTVADVSAALLFVAGSILFFSKDTVYAGTWMFLIGSIFFAAKPTIRLVREWHLLQIGDVSTLAQRARN